MVVGTTGGGMSYGELFYRRLLATKSRKGFAQLVGNYTPQKPIQDALELNRLRIPTQILTNACSSGSNAIGHGFELVRHGLRTCVVCGGYEPLCELVFVGFDSLQAATPEKIRPFDKNRTGLVLGEGAAFLILESEKKRGASRGRRYCGNGRLWSLDRYLSSDSASIRPASVRSLQCKELLNREIWRRMQSIM